MSTCISTWLFLLCEYTLDQWTVSCLSCSTLRTSFEQLKSRKQATWSATVPVLLLLCSFNVKWLILLFCWFWLQKSRTLGTFTSNCLIYWKRRWKRLRHSENGRESRGGRYWKKLLDTTYVHTNEQGSIHRYFMQHRTRQGGCNQPSILLKFKCSISHSFKSFSTQDI